MPLVKFEFPITVKLKGRNVNAEIVSIVSIQEQNNRINQIVITDGCVSSHCDLGGDTWRAAPRTATKTRESARVRWTQINGGQRAHTQSVSSQCNRIDSAQHLIVPCEKVSARHRDGSQKPENKSYQLNGNCVTPKTRNEIMTTDRPSNKKEEKKKIHNERRIGSKTTSRNDIITILSFRGVYCLRAEYINYNNPHFFSTYVIYDRIRLVYTISCPFFVCLFAGPGGNAVPRRTKEDFCRSVRVSARAV